MKIKINTLLTLFNCITPNHMKCYNPKYTTNHRGDYLMKEYFQIGSIKWKTTTLKWCFKIGFVVGLVAGAIIIIKIL